MITLYQREHCPSATKIRNWLGRNGVSYQIVNVPALGSQRHQVLELTGAAVTPVLRDGDTVVSESDQILDYLNDEYSDDTYGDPDYGLTRNLGQMDMSTAREVTTAALKEQGFGVLTEIDVQATLKKKIDVDFRPYLILGACNPKMAHEALSAELPIGLLLPCNVILTQETSGDVIVSAISPSKMFKLVNRPDVAPLASQVQKLLATAISSINV